MIEKVDHIGIAVPDLEEALAVYRDVLGLEFKGFETVEEQKVRVAKLKGGDDTIELLDPTEPDSPIG